jgi:hypothetical protein
VGPRAVLGSVVKRKVTSPCRESNSDRPARSPALYRLSYNGMKSGMRAFMVRPALRINCWPLGLLLAVMPTVRN